MKTEKRSIDAVLFDWDGTLADSAQIGLMAFEKSFADLGFEFNRETYEAEYSPNWYSLYESMNLPKEKWATADGLWIQYYGSQIADLLPGARETVAQLHQRGYRLGIVSSGSDCRVARELEHRGLITFFDSVVCNEHMTQKKPHPEGLETALRQLNCAPVRACYVGDSPEDIEMGRRANVMTVGVRSSYPTSWKLRDANPDLLLESLTDLLTQIQNETVR